MDTATIMRRDGWVFQTSPLIHADYNGPGGIVIDRYQERFEFSNPGTLLISREQLLQGGVSECRNKSLQKMFQLMGAGDKAGSGIDKIRKRWMEQHWQSPRLKETYRPDRVLLTLPMISTLPENVLKLLHQRFGKSFEELSQDEVQTLVATEVEGEVSNLRLQEMLAIHRVDITQMLKKLVHNHFLKAEGFGRGKRYLPNSEADLPNSDRNNSVGLPANSIGLGADIPINDTNIPISDANIPISGTDIPISDAVGLIEKVQKTSRVSPEVMRKAILLATTGRFLSIQELASILSRKPATLRDKYITALVKENLLELQYPQSPKRPDQKYRALDDSGSEPFPVQ